ncbi:MAG: DUF6316 family protein [Pseudomonadota bacterium]
MQRKNDTDQHADKRTPRMYEQSDGWFFSTREGDPKGPFRDEYEASTQLEVYIRMADSGMLR